MKLKSLIIKSVSMLPIVVVLMSCKKQPKEVEIVERRELCQYDNPSVYRGSYNSLEANQPLSWRQVSGTTFRLLNYSAGEATQIAVGQNRGGVLANLNRWKSEFDQEGLENLDGLEAFEMLGGQKAYVIDLKGTFQKKMGGMPMKAEGWAVIGVISNVADGSLVTIKMMGPEEEVVAERENLIRFAKSLRINQLQTPSKRSKKDAKVEESDGGGY